VGRGTNTAPEEVNLKYRHDPLLRAFVWLNSKSWLLLFAVGAVANYGVLALLVYASKDSGSPQQLRIPLWKDPFGYFNWILVVPALYVLSTGFLIRLGTLVPDLRRSGVVDVNNARTRERCDRFKSRLDSPWIAVFAFVAAAAAAAIIARTHSYPLDHWSSIAAAKVFLVAEGAVKAYIVATLAARVAVVVIFLRRVFRNPEHGRPDDAGVTIEPLHPDRCGGLGVLGSMSIALSTTVAALALNMSNPLIARAINGYGSFTPVSYLELLAYFTFIPAAFVLPLSAPHCYMKQAKETLLAGLSVNFEAQQREVLVKVQSGAALKDEDVEGLLNVRSLYNLGMKMPVWPFDVQTLSRVVSAVVIPLGIAIVSSLIG
jgi:hypothetical protein